MASGSRSPRRSARVTVAMAPATVPRTAVAALAIADGGGAAGRPFRRRVAAARAAVFLRTTFLAGRRRAGLRAVVLRATFLRDAVLRDAAGFLVLLVADRARARFRAGFFFLANLTSASDERPR